MCTQCRDGHKPEEELLTPSTSPTGLTGVGHGAETSVVDFNRGGTPFVEIVTEPDLRSLHEAAEFGRLLQATLRRWGSPT